MIEFYDDKGVIGTVAITSDNELDVSPIMESLVSSWLAKHRSMQDFEAFYDGWSNGYMSARRAQVHA